MLRAIVVAFVASGSLLAQPPGLVSPAGLDGTEGNSASYYLFSGAEYHYMQIHGDIQGTATPIRGIQLRRDGGTCCSTYSGRTVDLALWIGTADSASPSPTFAKNYTGPRTSVVAKKSISMPALPWSQTAPRPFDVVIPFDRPWAYSGTTALAWEAEVFPSTTGTSIYPLDAYRAGSAHSFVGQLRILGNGCAASATLNELQSAAQATVFHSPARVVWRHQSSNAPRLTTGAVLVGLTNPDLVFPICSGRLYTDASLATVPVRSGMDGRFEVTLYAAWNPVMQGMSIFSQSFVLSSLPLPLGIAVSNGAAATIPPRPGQPDYATIDAPSRSALQGTLTARFAQVTRFLR